MTEGPRGKEKLESPMGYHLRNVSGVPLATGLLAVGAIRFGVRILETRTVYGRTEVLVKPVAGEGQCWVTEGKVTKG